MNISDLLVDTPPVLDPSKKPIRDDELLTVWQQNLRGADIRMTQNAERNTLTDAVLVHESEKQDETKAKTETKVQIKVIGRHMNGSFRCHIGTGKASRSIKTTELCGEMRLLAVFFRTESSKSQFVSPEFLFFPSWLLHLFKYTEHGNTPGRTDVRFLEDATLAKEDHIYRLNNVLNKLFRFNLHNFNKQHFLSTVQLSNYLFDIAGLDMQKLPEPVFADQAGDSIIRESPPPALYTTLMCVLHEERAKKIKPMCNNCNTKEASRRRLCVACYRYQLKHNAPRPLNLIVANRPGPRVQSSAISSLSMNLYPPTATSTATTSRTQKKHCANCNVHETHQWYRNLCGEGHWCETCKSYYLRHKKVRPSELFIKAAKRKVDVHALVNWSSWSLDASAVAATAAAATHAVSASRPSIDATADLYDSRRSSSSSTTSTASSIWTQQNQSGSSSPNTVVSSPTTPPASHYHPKMMRPSSVRDRFFVPYPSYWSAQL